jgi:hypothetical protein
LIDPTPSKRPAGFAFLVLLALACALCALYYWRGLTSYAGPNYDDVVYLVMGKALATGHGYRMIALPEAPFQVAYPPGYPALLALVWTLFPTWPDNIFAFKAVNIVAALAASLGIYYLVTRVYRGSRLKGLLTATLTALSTGVIDLMDLTMSELVFMALVVGALCVIEPGFFAIASPSHPPSPAKTLRTVIIAGLLVAVVMLTKALGVTLAIAAGLWLLLRGRFTAAAGFALVVVLGNAPWQLWVRLTKASGAPVTWDYMAWVQQHTGGFNPLLLLHNVADNVPEVLTITFPLMLANITGSETLQRPLERFGLAPALVWLGYGAIAIAILGLVATARRSLRVYHLYVVCFLALALAFPWEPSRYTITLMPFLAYGYVEGCWLLGRVRPRALGKALLVAGLLLGLTGDFWRFASVLRPTRPIHDALLPKLEATELRDRTAFRAWALAHLPTDTLLVHERDPLAYLDTGRLAINYMDGLRPQPRALALFAAQPTYLVLMPHKPEYLTTHSALRSLLGPALPVFQAPEGTLEVYLLPRVWPNQR